MSIGISIAQAALRLSNKMVLADPAQVLVRRSKNSAGMFLAVSCIKISYNPLQHQILDDDLVNFLSRVLAWTSWPKIFYTSLWNELVDAWSCTGPCWELLTKPCWNPRLYFFLTNISTRPRTKFLCTIGTSKYELGTHNLRDALHSVEAWGPKSRIWLYKMGTPNPPPGHFAGVHARPLFRETII